MMGLVNYNKIRGFKFVKTSNNSVNAADLDGVIRARLLRLNPAMLDPLSIQGRRELGDQLAAVGQDPHSPPPGN